MARRIRIGVIGPGHKDAAAESLAKEVGRLAARAGAVLVCGGMGGAMEAASRGAQEAGGTVVGILPGFSADDANDFVDIPIVTGMSHARNTIIVWTCDALIAIHGEYGTLSEIALALKCCKPVIGLKTWELESVGCDDPNFRAADSSEEAVKLALKLCGKRKK
jgi:uncharacterized protein (TIGR00725 family)